MASFTDQIAKDECNAKPNWLKLPIYLTENILKRLDTVDIVTSARYVCPLWWNICKDPLMWRTIRLRDLDLSKDSDYFEKICRCAIHLSCGHVEDILIEYFGTDKLLKYMAHRASHLRRLQLFECERVSDEGLAEFVKTLPLLEKLDYISRRSYISKECLEDIGQCCPLLKSLNLETESCEYSNCSGHSDLFVIGKTMPGLCHLKIFGLVLQNDELLTILDGCPLLESLHLSKYGCYHLNRDLIKRCRVQIKDFKILYMDENEYLECQLDVEEDISNQFYLECQLDVGVSVNEYLE